MALVKIVRTDKEGGRSYWNDRDACWEYDENLATSHSLGSANKIIKDAGLIGANRSHKVSTEP